MSRINRRKRKLTLLRSSSNIKRQWALFAIDEGNVGAYVKHATNIKRPPTHSWQMPTEDPAREVIRTQGKDAYDLTIPIPIAAADELSPRKYMPANIRYNSTDDILPRKRTYFEEMFKLRSNLLAAGYDGGSQPFLNEAFRSKEYAEKYDKEHGTHTLEKTLLTISETAYQLVYQANEGRQIADESAFGKQGVVMKPSGSVGRSVVINVNRPLIEHMTITSTGLKEGGSDMRKQVEEALLDILNSTDIR